MGQFSVEISGATGSVLSGNQHADASNIVAWKPSLIWEVGNTTVCEHRDFCSELLKGAELTAQW